MLDDLLWVDEAKRLTNLGDQKLFYDRANRDVAILCNHQRSVGKAHEVHLRTVFIARNQRD